MRTPACVFGATWSRAKAAGQLAPADRSAQATRSAFSACFDTHTFVTCTRYRVRECNSDGFRRCRCHALLRNMAAYLACNSSMLTTRSGNRQAAARSSLLPLLPRRFVAPRPVVAALSGAENTNWLPTADGIVVCSCRCCRRPHPPRQLLLAVPNSQTHPPAPNRLDLCCRQYRRAPSTASAGLCRCVSSSGGGERLGGPAPAEQVRPSAVSLTRHGACQLPAHVCRNCCCWPLSSNPNSPRLAQQAVLERNGAAGRPRGCGGSGGRRLLGQHSAGRSARRRGCQALLRQQHACQVGLFCGL